MKSNHVDSRSWSAAMADSLQSQHASINNLVKTPHGPNIIPVLSPIRRVKMCTDKSAVGSFLRQFTKKTVLSHCIQPCWLSSPGEKVPLFFFSTLPRYLPIISLHLLHSLFSLSIESIAKLHTTTRHIGTIRCGSNINGSHRSDPHSPSPSFPTLFFLIKIFFCGSETRFEWQLEGVTRAARLTSWKETEFCGLWLNNKTCW